MGPAREAIVPEFSKRIIQNPVQGNAYFSSAINLIALLLLGSAASILLGSHFFSDLVVSPEQRAIYERLVVTVVLMVPLSFLNPAYELFSNLLAAYQRVLIQNVVRIASSMVLMISMALLASHWGVNAAILGLITGQSVACAVLLIALRKAGLRYEWRSRPVVDAAFLRLAGALLFAHAVSQLYILFERNTLTSFGEGVVSAYQYAAALSHVPQMILIASLTTAMWPELLAAARNGQLRLTVELINSGWNILAPALTLIMLFGLVFAEHIVYLLFFRGTFDARSLQLTSLCFTSTVIALPFYGLYLIVGRVLLSHHAGPILAIIGAGAAVAGIAVVGCGRLLESLPITVLNVAANAVAGAVLSLLMLRAILGKMVARNLSRQVFSTFGLVAATSATVWALYPVVELKHDGYLKVGLELLVHLLAFSSLYGMIYVGLRLIKRHVF